MFLIKIDNHKDMFQVLSSFLAGMGFRPMPDVDSTLIRFEQGKASSYKMYTDHIQAFLERK